MTSLTIPAHMRRPLLIALAANIFAFYLARKPLMAALHQEWRPHLPNLDLFAHQSLAIQLHTGFAFIALGVAIYLLSGRKGTRTHRLVGWGWTIAMMVTAVSSFFIMELNRGHLSLIHILAGVTALVTPFGVWAARSHKVALHRGVMTGLVFGGLFIASALTFVPGRLMWRLFFG